MKINSIPKELFIEVLSYLADYEPLNGLHLILDSQYTTAQVRSALREVATHFRKELEEEKGQVSLVDLRKDEKLSPKVKDVLSILSPGDERRLLDRFGLLDQ